MGLSCDSDGGDYDWYWTSNFQYYPLLTKRSRKCCSCKERIAVGEESMIFRRYRDPRNYIEERIYDDEVPMAKWYLCETCGDLAISLQELGFCFTLGGGESLKKQISDYRQAEAEYIKRYKVKPTAKDL